MERVKRGEWEEEERSGSRVAVKDGNSECRESAMSFDDVLEPTLPAGYR
jgi:hypothetical protein